MVLGSGYYSSKAQTCDESFRTGRFHSKNRQKMAFDQGSIAFIEKGLGVMGYPMAMNLRKKIASDRTLLVCDINQDAIKRFQDQTKSLGPVKVVDTAYEAFQQADLVLTMLPSDAAVKSVYLDPEAGLFAAAKSAGNAGPRKLLMECGTIAQATISEVSKISKDYNVTFIDAPVSGGPMGSEAGTLSFMVGCDEDMFPQVKGLLSLMGREDSIFRCGAVGSGTAFKIINNYISIISILSVSEALNIGHNMGLDMRLLVDLINSSSGQCWVSSNNNPVPGIHPNAPASHDYEGGFRIELAEKVLRLGSNMSVRLQTRTCPDPSVNCQQAHPNIQSYMASIQLDLETIGHVKARVFNKQTMDAKNSPGMWEECQRYDQVHFGAKLDKIDNYLDNESFESDAEVKVREARAIVYVEEVLLGEAWRGQGLGLDALRRSILALRLPRESIILLEPGPINSAEHNSQSDNAGEKLEKHWRQLGFDAWSYTDRAWLCLSLGDVSWGCQGEVDDTKPKSGQVGGGAIPNTATTGMSSKMSSEGGAVGKESINTEIITLSRYLSEEQTKHKEATGDFTLLCHALQFSFKSIAYYIRRASLINLSGLAGSSNTTGDDQKKLDVIGNDIFIAAMRSSGRVRVLVSEEEEEAIIFDQNPHARYAIACDPIDGSSNLDAGVSVGTIFGIYRLAEGAKGTKEDLLVPGSDLVAAGFTMYGASAQLVMTMKDGPVNGFTMDNALGEFILTHPDMKIPKKRAIYSCNEGNSKYWEEPVKEWCESLKNAEKPYSARYIGSMVADAYRTLLYGGIFAYPADKKSPKGKLRILYECGPMAMVFENAGGQAVDSNMRRMVTVVPEHIHDRSGIFLGSYDEVQKVIDIHKKHGITAA
ncbi:hypothetical protein AC578_4145 [Pseudocercospora eumusae]|uniref:Fructose-1,6-bisphosphatase n=1 Tax=Pseudocercospora eumusae TaxID=321146 RepID=A0A139GWG3_9PEZI|nr:hypothetical protein AC578_4145 [Pseudocercospora eumusae]